MFEGEEENMIWGIVENVLMRNNVQLINGKMSIRFYEDGNPELEELEKVMKQFDNYELTTLDYTLKYYLEQNPNLDEDVEWCNLVRKKIDQTILSQAQIRYGVWLGTI